MILLDDPNGARCSVFGKELLCLRVKQASPPARTSEAGRW
jgi:hypothetical protein